MTIRLTLVSPATNGASRGVRFDDDSPLDAEGLARAEAATGWLPPAVHVHVSPSVRCRQTARALGLDAEPLSAIAACDMGHWRGRTLGALAATDEHAVARWLGDPDAAPHGGESLRDFRARIGVWLDGLHGLTGRVIAVAEPDTIRAALIHALAAPDQAFWRLDIRPLTATDLSGRAGRWNLRNGRPLGAE
ncbi:histidine phosphatase family protein [Yinghuangia sp. ASG 101]|uniref:histidine phosphatase family protein n=1 Tax=Yinghuangia sp. ASG 101 TaxID=2896848 RepID=UPI001E3F1A8C|nr:histidine phosphatase family protein [Yinghuangia sp. ASG 101]UGQ11706.1 histidine phosphatase family protein [Yinghuangia sp. ASG 101]